MKHEFWAGFDLYGIPDKKEEIIESLVGKKQLSGQWTNIKDAAIRQQVLAQLLATDEECARRTKCKDYARGKNGLQHWYYAGDITVPQGDYQTFLRRRLRWMGTVLDLASHEDTVGTALPALSLFPRGSWAIQVHFTLRKPYISKDDMDFYILDNPVKKEWVFKVPYVAPSQWKGALRAAMRRQRGYTSWEEEARDEQMARLFGNVKGAEVDFSAGRLHFYPTFFDRIGLEVINPHDRKTGAGKQPIYFECVPAGTEGVFTLLYVPLDQVGRSSRKEMGKEAKTDLEAVAHGIRAMLTEYGFGAKTSSGYGVADVKENGVEIRANGIEKAEEVFWKGWETSHGCQHRA